MSHTASPTPREALARLLEGNARFTTSQPQYPNVSAEHRTRLREGQSPFAVVVGCSDSRVSVELLFDQGFGDLFVVRNAGHVLGRSTQASVEFAVSQLGVGVVFVLGHESCGAVAGTVQFLEEGTTLPGEMPLLVELVQEHLDPSSPRQDAVTRHVRGTIEDLLEKSALVRDAREAGEIVVAGGVYGLEDGHVQLVWEDASAAPSETAPR